MKHTFNALISVNFFLRQLIFLFTWSCGVIGTLLLSTAATGALVFSAVVDDGVLAGFLISIGDHPTGNFRALLDCR